jgi:hypothetical protein
MLNVSRTPTVSDVPLDLDLAKRLERATSKVERDLDERDALILLAYIRGASLRDIGEAAGLTHVGVKKLVERRYPDFIVVDETGQTIAVIEAKNSPRRDYTIDQIQPVRGAAE